MISDSVRFLNKCIFQFEGAFIYLQRGHRAWSTNPRFCVGLADLIDTTKKEVCSFEELPEFIQDVTKHIEAVHTLDEYSAIAVFNMIK